MMVIAVDLFVIIQIVAILLPLKQKYNITTTDSATIYTL